MSTLPSTRLPLSSSPPVSAFVHDTETIDVSRHPQTAAIRHGSSVTEQGEHHEAMFLTSSFVFNDASQAAARFSGDEPGNVYSRFTNPTVATFEKRLAELEGGKYCVAMASGMAAITALMLTMLKAGDHVVASSSLFGTTVSMFTKVFNRFGVETSFVDIGDVAKWREQVKTNTRLFFLESPSNPLCDVADIAALAETAHKQGVKLVVDNAFCTPALSRPLALGADIVVHSATKYLDGQGRCVGGAVVTNDPVLSDELVVTMRTCGPTLSPFNAWTFTNGLETLGLRMAEHSRNALQLAKWLSEQASVERVFYPGLSNHPGHKLASKQMNGYLCASDRTDVYYGGIVSFEVRGGKNGAWKVIDSTEFLSITANLGDTKTTITHPATTTHGRLTQDQRDRAGIRDGLIRVSVGLEHIQDIIADIDRGLH